MTEENIYESLREDRLRAVESIMSLLKQVGDQEKMYLDGIREGLNISIREGRLSNAVIYGLGGSGIVGSIASTMLNDYSPLPLISFNGASLPSWVGTQSLLILISYSGNTIEVVNQAVKAAEKRMPACVICSGGRLDQISRERGLPVVKVRAGLTPRMAVPEMLGAASSILERAGVVPKASLKLRDALPILKKINESCSPSIEALKNPAKLAALHIYRRLPVVVCSSPLYPAALRLKNQLNENSKMPCIVVEVPEAMHNTLEALPYTESDKYLSIRWSGEDEYLAFQMDYLRRLLGDLVLEKRFEGNHIEAMLSALMWADYVSIYLAALRKVDPLPVENITRFRRDLDKLKK